MKKRSTYLLAWWLIASFVCGAQSSASTALTAEEYRAQLDQLLSATEQLDSSGHSIPQVLHDVPQSWHVRTEQGEFEISAEGLHRDLRRYESEQNVTNATVVRARIQNLRQDLDGYEKPPADTAIERNNLNAILARPEFHDVRGPTWLDRLKEKLLLFVAHLLERLFRSSSIPTISKFFVYGVVGIAILALAYFAYRNLVWGTDFEAVTPKDLPVSAKEWTLWLAEARSAAAGRRWRDAIHLAYWAGISFLESQGAWKPDVARTPREYLKLLGSSSEHKETLSALTRVFELTWYAKRDADDKAFSQALSALERLGCR